MKHQQSGAGQQYQHRPRPSSSWHEVEATYVHRLVQETYGADRLEWGLLQLQRGHVLVVNGGAELRVDPGEEE